MLGHTYGTTGQGGRSTGGQVGDVLGMGLVELNAEEDGWLNTCEKEERGGCSFPKPLDDLHPLLHFKEPVIPDLHGRPTLDGNGIIHAKSSDRAKVASSNVAQPGLYHVGKSFGGGH